MDALKVIFLFALLAPFSYVTLVVDYCVADFNHPVGPAGYPCKNPASLTADDFVFSGLRNPSIITNQLFNLNSAFAIDVTFPSLNGLGLSMGRLDFGVGGAVPIHSHRVSELILISEGTIVAGFIDTNGTAFYKTLHKGDIMIFPPTLLHFQVNVGKIPALAFVTLNSPSPGFEITTPSLGGNDLPTELVKKMTLLDAIQVKKLKKLFGGTN
ncbi:auxin-binding protein ABP19a-like [Chenopodium quinoa]|uniref:auxin-binding protein ABP19a-like n=1 Tax=Chenopodium quinoa TaxID=63459 RepID=UPI000B7702BE|nr:auxin-binding protein ABP19a-like [Chenopodium quinoa]